MEWDLARGLREYIRQVALACGSGDVFSVQLETPLSAYIPLENRVAAFPELDVALVWDARTGWSSAVETTTNELITLTYLPGSMVPSPEAVATFAASPASGASTPAEPTESGADVEALLAEYAALRPLAG
jgi:hypothetical protein